MTALEKDLIKLIDDVLSDEEAIISRMLNALGSDLAGETFEDYHNTALVNLLIKYLEDKCVDWKDNKSFEKLAEHLTELVVTHEPEKLIATLESFMQVQEMVFRNNYYFLSNMFPCTISYNGKTYKCAEAAFQAQKDLNSSLNFTEVDGFTAKKYGRKVNLRKDWNSVRVAIMKEILIAKFTQTP